MVSPRDIAAKLHWLKLYDRRPVYGTLVDKFDVRDYVAQRAGPEILNACFGEYRDPADIDLSTLPPSFIVKATHGWNMNFACPDKTQMDQRRFMRTARDWLATRHELRHAEWAYSLVKPRLIIEELIGDEELTDYKFFCFNGEPQFFKIDLGRGAIHCQSYFTLEWDPLPFRNPRVATVAHFPNKPDEFGQMIEVARRLCADIPFVRVDLYNVASQIRFGELTLYPCGGNLHVTPPEWGDAIGDLLSLPAPTPS